MSTPTTLEMGLRELNLDHNLTGQERQSSYQARLDLGPAYPQLPVARYVRRIYSDTAIGELSLAHPSTWTATREAQLDHGLESALMTFLGIAEDRVDSVKPTFSGGAALDRALAAAIHMCTSDGAGHVHVITCSPSIDIMRLFLEERGKALTVHFVESNHRYVGGLDVEGLLAQIRLVRRSHVNDGVIVLLTSPENPTGEIWGRKELADVGVACIELEGVLIVDHAYLTAGVHDREDVPCIWDVMPVDCDWIAVWDTGKTFGLNEEKLGFVLSGSASASANVGLALSTLQYGVSRRQKLVFSQLFQGAIPHGHVRKLRDVCRQNLATASRVSGEGPIKVRRTNAGSVAMLELVGSASSDEEMRCLLLEQGIGVVAGRVFFHTSWRPTKYLRVALARSPDYFERAIAELVGCIPPARGGDHDHSSVAESSGSDE